MQVGRGVTYFNNGEEHPAIVVKDWGASESEHLINLLVLSVNGNELKTSVQKWTPEREEQQVSCWKAF